MSKSDKARYLCRECGGVQPKWVGRCPECGTWDSLEKERAPARTGSRLAAPSGPELLSKVSVGQEARSPMGIEELDHVLGGGLVHGQTVLLGGEPGIGKSTLLLQACAGAANDVRRVLYVCAEESPSQVKLRARRLGVDDAEIHLLAETSLDAVQSVLDESGFHLLVVDSIQMMHLDEVPGAPGSVAQLRECGMAMAAWAKRTGACAFLVGHVTKDGAIAGPKLLEHIVDTVLYFEGDRFQSYRLLRAVKNRFGPTLELGIFEMRGEGLTGVDDPSGVFLAHARLGEPGGAVVPCMEGRRPLLLEIQALVAPSPYGTAVRRANGLDGNRLPMLLAVLEKKGGLSLAGHDVFLNVVGGARITEPAADLGAILAVASSLREKPLPQGLIVAGEVGLKGEVRPVPQSAARLAEAAKLGFRRALFPKGSFAGASKGKAGLDVFEIGTLSDGIRWFVENGP